MFTFEIEAASLVNIAAVSASMAAARFFDLSSLSSLALSISRGNLYGICTTSPICELLDSISSQCPQDTGSNYGLYFGRSRSKSILSREGITRGGATAGSGQPYIIISWAHLSSHRENLQPLISWLPGVITKILVMHLGSAAYCWSEAKAQRSWMVLNFGQICGDILLEVPYSFPAL